jgi:tetratricopeptide (TPR) repeat protein
MRNDDWKDPRHLWSEVIRTAPESPVGYNDLGVAYAEDGNMPVALSYYKIALGKDRDYAKAYANIAKYYFDRGEYNKSLATANIARNIDREDLNLKSYQQLIISKIRERKPVQSNESAAASNHIRMLLQKNDTQGALRVSEDALKKYPNDTRLLNDAGVVNLSVKNYDKAITHLQKALHFDPSDAATYYNLAHAYAAKGEREEAKYSLKVAIQMKPDFKEAQQMLDTLK